MTTFLSLVTSIKDYVEIVHKLIETPSEAYAINYYELGSIITYSIIAIKNFIYNVISLNWLNTIWHLPVIIPEISSAMISEISVLDGYFHNAFNFLDTPVSYGTQNTFIYSLEKFVIGLINSLFFVLPTGTAHLITLRRFVMQGLEAGYIAGLGTICGNILWISSIILGFRFFVIPWLSLDIFRYILGFILLVKYMWDSYNERRMVLEDLSKQKIFLLNFLLALTEQTSIYPFISNISIGSESSILESFPADSYVQFLSIHFFYILGLIVGSLSLLHFTCWFWENPAFKIYMWTISSFKVSTSFYYKVLNFTFLYLTMICAISSIPYYGLDYTLTNPLGFEKDDRITDQKLVLETSFLSTKASDRNTRRNRGRHGRRERWKRRVRKYRTFDASLYDQGVYDLFSLEDLNYGFDRFWLRRKMRNHRVRFRFFPGPWMRSFKKQLAKPRLESYAGPRQEFFRILFEQVYHPSFHSYTNSPKNFSGKQSNKLNLQQEGALAHLKNDFSIYSVNQNKANLKFEFGSGSNSVGTSSNDLAIKSTLRKFVRKINTRVKSSEIALGMSGLTNVKQLTPGFEMQKNTSFSDNKEIYSKRWKHIFSKIYHNTEQQGSTNRQLKGFLRNFYKKALTIKSRKTNGFDVNFAGDKKENSRQQLSKKDQQILRYRSMFLFNNLNKLDTKSFSQDNQKLLAQGDKTVQTLFHPLNFYLQKQQAFERKLHYYTPTVFRKFSIENNAPYFRVMMKKYFYYYKPTLRWEKTIKVGSLRKARRKKARIPRKLQPATNISLSSNMTATKREKTTTRGEDLLSESTNSKLNSLTLAKLKDRFEKPTHNYSVVGKKASRYRYQIYKDVLQHWYYSPFNRLLLKFDIDSFIRRQPTTHFLTNKEENLLHLRRFLLSEHYNTLRWYTYMQHYRSMKTKIGGTKSFASRTYNQQFVGTFKKIRHLFAITPSQGEQTVLKFDQPLYNESYNTAKKPFINTYIIHEELLDPNYSVTTQTDPNNGLLGNNTEKLNSNGEDLVNQSTKIVREYLLNATPIREEYIKNLISEKNYSELGKFIYKGQKTRGNQPATNESSFLAQEKEYILTNSEKLELKRSESNKIYKFLRENNLQQDLWINLLKKWKRKVNDQEFLKNYLTRRVEKREKRKQKKEISLKNKLTKLESWLNNVSNENQYWQNLDIKPSIGTPLKSSVDNTAFPGKELGLSPSNGFFSSSPTLKNKENSVNASLSTGVQKALMEGTLIADKIDLKTINQTEKKFWKLKTLSNLSNGQTTNSSLNGLNSLASQVNLVGALNIKLLTNTSQLKNEKNLRSSIKSLTEIINRTTLSTKENFVESNKNTSNKKTRAAPFERKIIYNRLFSIYTKFQNQLVNFLGVNKLVTIFKPIKNKSLDNWRKKEQALGKQKRIRKEFKAFSKKKEPKEEPSENSANKFLFENSDNKSDFEKNMKYLSQKTNGEKMLTQQNTLGLKSQPVGLAFESSGNLKLIERKKREEQMETRYSSEKIAQQRVTFNEIVNTEFNQKSSILDQQADKNSNFISKRLSFITDSFSGMPWVTLQAKSPKEFKRKRTPHRRSASAIPRMRRYRSRKPNLKTPSLTGEINSLKDEFKTLFKTNDSSTENGPALNTINKNLYLMDDQTRLKDLFILNNKEKQIKTLKQRRSLQQKQRSWKQKRAKYSQNLRKYRKRRRYAVSKIRNLNKQLKRIQSKMEIQNWWWNNFTTNLKASTDALWQIEKDRQIQEKLLELSNEPLQNRLNQSQEKTTTKSFNLEVGDYDFKPLALSRTVKDLANSENLTLGQSSKSMLFAKGGLLAQQASPGTERPEATLPQKPANWRALKNASLEGSGVFSENPKLFEELMCPNGTKKNLAPKPSQSIINPEDAKSKVGTVNITPMPFYAGWDESLRKFVITNRLLSQRESGYTLTNNLAVSQIPGLKSENKINKKQNLTSQIPGLLPLWNSISQNNIQTNSEEKATSSNILEFTSAPLKGMNAATTLYWQIPFTTYDPDQFFALGMDGFSPIGWRRFEFRHSILKSWLYKAIPPIKGAVFPSTNLKFSQKGKGEFELGETKTSLLTQVNSTSGPARWELKNINSISKEIIVKQNNLTSKNQKNSLLYKFKEKDDLNLTKTNPINGVSYETKKNIYRRLKKRFSKRVKRHPRTPTWYPSGPLLNQVLPVHYIYVFYKRYRLPKDRYLKRHLRKTLTTIPNGATNKTRTESEIRNSTQFSSLEQNPIDFTLRKRVKTKRKYHRKKESNKQSPILPRRVKFLAAQQGALPSFGGHFTTQASKLLSPTGVSNQSLGEDVDVIRWRPLSRQKFNKPINQQRYSRSEELIKEQRAMKNKQRKKEKKQPANLLRVKQLRRRVQRQLIRSVWRYKPRAGGFVWPGDYLKMELVKAPKLSQIKNKVENNTTPTTKTQVEDKKRKNKRKKKRTLQEWQLQPKKYLLQKHNFKVIKKKLEKAQRSNKIQQKIKELNFNIN